MKMSCVVITSCLAGAIPLFAHAAEPAQCNAVRFSEIGWTDNAVTTALARQVLEGLGYTTRSSLLSVPITLKSLADGKDMDVFLGNWMPSMASDMAPYQAASSIDVVRINLQNAKYTLAVNEAIWQQGLKDFADIPRFKEQLGAKIYGIEPGNDGNRHIEQMIEANAFGLKNAGFKLVESSEAGMLSQVERVSRREAAVVFLGWEPHPMNTRFKIRYLTGGDEFFGPNFGSATVYTLTRKGFASECPNVGRFLSNLGFTLDMESALMSKVLDDKIKVEDAARQWLKQNPQLLAAWLDGVSARDGKPGAEALAAHLVQ
ncbi:choline ABC transporter substrate-binding protein [Pseudomonas sp. 3A(2025)]